MAGKFAQQTSVSVSQSKFDIEKTLRRYGASRFASGWDDQTATLAFEIRDRMVRFVVKMPRLDQFKKTDTGRDRSASVAMAAWEQATRSTWRSLLLCIQAKLEAVEAEIATFDDEFLAYMVMGDGRTVSQHVATSLNTSLSSNQQLMLGAGS